MNNKVVKNLFYWTTTFIVAVISASACSDNISDSEGKGPAEEITEETTQIKLKAEKGKGNIFELIEFEMYTETNTALNHLIFTYDSLIWKVSDVEGRFEVLEKGSSTKMTFSWSHNFFYPGEYKTILLGYKNEKMITNDTVTIKILNNKDFLGYNWSEITSSAKYYTGYANVLSNKYSFGTCQTIYQGVPSVTLLMLNERKDDESVFNLQSKKILSDYISSLYSSPTYDESDKNALLENYNKLFKHKEENTYPESIWITPKSKVVLLKYVDEFESKYLIYAEPI